MPQKPTKPIRKAQLWAKRSVHLKSYLQDLPRRLRLDVEALVKIFLTRRSLLLKLADNYLIRLWECSRATAQRRLATLEELGLIRRMTQPPRKQPNGTWKQERKLVLILPKKPNSLLVSHSGSQANLQASPAVDNSTQRVKAKPKMPYVDYLSLQAKVSKGSFAFFLRQNNANPKTMGYLLSHIHQRIRNRPDVLESVLFDAEAQKLKDSRLIGFVVNEIKSRIPA
jgi:hypothetical protein